jgi:hypothetical protein
MFGLLDRHAAPVTMAGIHDSPKPSAAPGPGRVAVAFDELVTAM